MPVAPAEAPAKKAKVAKPALSPEMAAIMAGKLGVTAEALLKTMDASRDQARQDKMAAREAAKKDKELHRTQMSREQLVAKFGEAEAKAELARRNAKALEARKELKAKAKEWQSLTDEVARLTKLCDDHGIDHKVEVDASDTATTDVDAPTDA
jgi:superfamily II RNA helicase